MRPESLNPAFKPLTSLKGCGPRLAKLLGGLAGGERLLDLWWHRPLGVVDRRFRPRIAEAPDGAVCTIAVTVDRILEPRSSRLPTRIICTDATGSLTVVYFNGHPETLRKLYPPGGQIVISGRVEHYNGEPQMPHPDFAVPAVEADSIPAVQPVYPLAAGLAARVVAKLVRQAVSQAPPLPEWLAPALLQKHNWPAWQVALRGLHSPASQMDVSADAPARQRLAFDEMLATQLAMGLVRLHARRAQTGVLQGDGHLRRKVLSNLPWQLTKAQLDALTDIERDLASERRMQRLVQGDVGSGKTVVALLAMLIAVEAGAQAALMAPTEILAQQHFNTLSRLLAGSGVEVALLTGKMKGTARQQILERLAGGALPIIVGTHALFQEGVAFRDLALVVIDEQHRFGVHQRLALSAKGGRNGVDTLVMTATPIPRTLALTAYGDLDISSLREKPPGRKPVDTRALPAERFDDVVAGLRRRVLAGGRAYWVCPLVEESELIDLAAAEERHAMLARMLPDLRVGLLHGRMKSAEKDAAMAAFAAGETQVLVATTVIEVGVDVPEATLMVIEHADRFGLSQLHQLRGRVGRGGLEGACILLYAPPLGETARARLNILRQTEDGFLIAEEDLRLRGAGDMLGTKQSGTPDFRLADLDVHGDLLSVARQEARYLVETDPGLTGPRGPALRALLYLFERDAAIRYLSG